MVDEYRGAVSYIREALWARVLEDRPYTEEALTSEDPALLALIEATWGSMDAALEDAGLRDPGYDTGIGLRQWGSEVVGIYIDDFAPLPRRNSPDRSR